MDTAHRNQATHKSKLDRIFEMFDLSAVERKVILESRMAKSAVTISRLAGVPQTTLSSMLSRLERRGLMKRIGEGHKRVIWKQDIAAAIRELSSLSIGNSFFTRLPRGFTARSLPSVPPERS